MMSDVDSTMRDNESDARRRQWLPIKIEFVGKLTETILGGGGKCSPMAGDPGDGRKNKGNDPACH